MAKKPNKLLRTLVPIGAIIIVIGLLAAVYVNQVQTTGSKQAGQQQSQPQAGPAQQQETPPDEDQAQSPDEVDPGEPLTPDTPPAEQVTRGPSIAPGTTLRARQFSPEDLGDLALGAANVTAPQEFHIELSPYGAGIRSLVLAHHFQSIAKVDPTELQAEQSFFDNGTLYALVTPFAALGVTVEGQYVSLIGTELAPTWRAIDGRPGAFEAYIVDDDDAALLRIERVWEIENGSYDITLGQSIQNLTDRPLDVAWTQLGPIDMPLDSVTYGGDKRRLSFGYLENVQADPTQQFVKGGEYAAQGRRKILGKKIKLANGARVWDQPGGKEIWPNKRSQNQGLTLVWVAMKSRYFAVAAHPLVDTDQATPVKRFTAVSTIDRVIVNERTEPDVMDLVIATRLNSGQRELKPGQTLDLSMGVYAGPVHASTIKAEPEAAAAGLGQLVHFSFGGMCAFCTFQWLAGWLIDLLRFLHDYVVFDWALSIIMLVVIVRTILHPITRWSQIRMNRFGKQMQALGPKQQKINEKYKDDPKRKQEEMAKLMREEGINPAGMLGCLPMFLQSPIWIALYATLYFAYDLQHQPAFFGVFQKLFPLNWPVMGHFLGDLSEPDRFIYFNGRSFDIPLISGMMGPISSFNILPILLGFVFFAHQKYLTPPTTASLSPEQQQQQKIMKVMMVVMFPFIMYNAPSGLALYFIANSALGIFESRHIRISAEKKGLLDVEKKPGGKPGFMQRMMELAAQQQNAKAGGAPARPHSRGPQQRRPKKR